MSSYIVDQESFLDDFASRLGTTKENLSDERLRLGAAMYADVLLPIAALVELRTHELDIADSYRKFNFEPEVPTYATANVTVTVRSAPTTNPYVLRQGFTVRQNNLSFLATSDLVIDIGKTTGTFTIKAQAIGTGGTPQIGEAQIASSVAWLGRALISVSAVSAGRDGRSIEEVQREFGIAAQNPDALVTAKAHADFLFLNYPDIARVISAPRTRVDYINATSRYNYEFPIAGHLSLAVIMRGGTKADMEQRRNMKALLLNHTVPYGDDRLHLVPIFLKEITASRVLIKKIPSAPTHVVQKSVFEAFQRGLDWQTWEEGKPVHIAELTVMAQQAAGVQFVQDIRLRGRQFSVQNDSEGNVDRIEDNTTQVTYELLPYELPVNGISESDIEVY